MKDEVSREIGALKANIWNSSVSEFEYKSFLNDI